MCGQKKKKKLVTGVVYGEKYRLAYKLLRFTEKPLGSSRVYSIVDARTSDKLSVKLKERRMYSTRQCVRCTEKDKWNSADLQLLKMSFVFLVENKTL